MKIIKIFTFIFLITTVSCITTKKGNHFRDDIDIIVWQEHSKLEFNDFKAEVKPLEFKKINDVVAACASGIWMDPRKNFRFIWDGKVNNIQIFAYFSKKESWFEPSSFSKEILEHEQLHFDISELIARKLREKINSYSKAITQDQLHFEYENFSLELRKLQEQYDYEVLQDSNGNEQLKWNIKIKNEISKLDLYKNAEIHIKSAKTGIPIF
ncbi:MAG: hypothetical protein ACRCVT_00035 [Leadbetterella sp.]